MKRNVWSQNWMISLLPDGAAVANGDSFIYGGGLTAAFDVWLTDRIIFLLQVKERALFGTDHHGKCKNG